MLETTTEIFDDDSESMLDSANDVLANLAGVHPDKVQELSSEFLLARICKRHPEVFDPIDVFCELF